MENEKQYQCDKCLKVYTNKQGFCGHRGHCGKNRKPYVHHKNKNKKPWNAGLTKETDIRMANIAKKVSETNKSKHFTGKAKTEEAEILRKQKISATMKKNKKSGGYRRKSGKCKGIWYDSKFAGRIFLRGTYEIFYAKFLDENNIAWKQNENGFSYVFENKERKYYPDFILVDENVYVEIKGFITEKDKAKWNYFPHKLKVILYSDLEKLGFDYNKEYKKLMESSG